MSNELPVSRTETAASVSEAELGVLTGPSDMKGSSTTIDIPSMTNEKVYDNSTDDDDDQIDTTPSYISRFYKKYLMLFQ